MASGDGVITREDVIKKEALNWGPEYVAQIDMSVAANKKMAASLKEINDQASQFRNAKSQEEYITLKQRQSLENQKIIDSDKQLALAETNIQKIEQERIKTKKLKLDLDSKEEASKKRLTKLTVEERLEIEKTNRLLKLQAIANLGLKDAYASLNAQRTLAKRTLLDLLAAENQDTKAIKEATKAFEALDKRVRSADKAVGDFTKNVGNYPTLKGFTSGLKDLIGAFGIVGGVQAFASIVGDAYKTIKQFEQGLADLSAITGATGKDLNFLRDNAIDLGQKVQGGAIAVVEAYKLIAGAKPELLSNVQALNQVTDAAITLSQAAGIELPAAATALTDAMNQFGADASRAQEFIDALANGAKFGSAEIPQLTEALLKFGAVARSSNISIQESAALVELLAENGIKGADAGTALRNVLLKISAPDALPKAAQKSLRDLGISFDLLKDKTIPIQDKFEALKPLLVDNGKLLKAFGFENIVAAQNIIEHTARLKELTGQMGEVGTAAEQAAIRMNTLDGKTEILKSTYDSFILSIGKGSGVISDFFKFFIEGATGALQSLIRLNTSWDELFDKAKQEGAAMGANTFQSQFNTLVSPKISDEERKNIRSRVKEINAALAAGYDDPALIDEKSKLLKRLGLGSDEEIAATIRKSALNQRKVLLDEYLKNEAAIIEAEKGGFFKRNVLGSTAQRDKLKEEKERLIKAIAEQNAIIIAAQNKVRGIRNPKAAITSTAGITDTGTDDKAEKERLKRLKALNDAEFELEKARLERNVKVNQEITDDEKLNDDIRIASAQNVQESQFELIELSKKHALDYDKFVLDGEKLTNDQKLLIQYETYAKQVDAAEKYQKDLEKIRVFDEESYKKSLAKQISENQIKENADLQAENERFKTLGDIEALSNKKREEAIEEHERNVFEIKKKYAIEALKLQIANLESELIASDKLPKAEQLTSEKRQEIAEKLSKAKLDLSEVEVSNNKKQNQTEVLTEREKAEQILSISSDLTGALNDLASALFEGRIQKIDEEIEKNNEKYDKAIEAADGNEKQIELLEKERDKKNAVLEQKKRKEQHKQAVYNKAAALAQAGISTALAVLAALSTQPFLPLGPAMAILAGVLGGIQIAAIAAAPIPKYKTGRKGGKREMAYVGDGGVSEVIERKSGKIELTPARDTLVELMAGDNVYRDIEDFKKNGRHTVLSNNLLEQRKMNEYHNITIKDNGNSKEMLKELKLTRKAIQKQKFPSQSKLPDLNHELWKYKNVKS